MTENTTTSTLIFEGKSGREYWAIRSVNIGPNAGPFEVCLDAEGECYVGDADTLALARWVAREHDAECIAQGI